MTTTTNSLNSHNRSYRSILCSNGYSRRIDCKQALNKPRISKSLQRECIRSTVQLNVTLGLNTHSNTTNRREPNKSHYADWVYSIHLLEPKWSKAWICSPRQTTASTQSPATGSCLQSKVTEWLEENENTSATVSKMNNFSNWSKWNLQMYIGEWNRCLPLLRQKAPSSQVACLHIKLQQAKQKDWVTYTTTRKLQI